MMQQAHLKNSPTRSSITLVSNTEDMNRRCLGPVAVQAFVTELKSDRNAIREAARKTVKRFFCTVVEALDAMQWLRQRRHLTRPNTIALWKSSRLLMNLKMKLCTGDGPPLLRDFARCTEATRWGPIALSLLPSPQFDGNIFAARNMPGSIWN